MIAFVVATAMAQDAVSCVATDDSRLAYAEWHKSGGAAPAQDTPMDTVSWSIGDAAIEAHTRTYGDLSDPLWKLDWAWDTTKTVVQSRSGDGMSGQTVYTSEVRLWTRDGSALGPLAVSTITVPMRCTQTRVSGIP